VQIIDVLTLSWQNADIPVKVHGAAARVRVFGSHSITVANNNAINVSLIVARFIWFSFSLPNRFVICFFGGFQEAALQGERPNAVPYHQCRSGESTLSCDLCATVGREKAISLVRQKAAQLRAAFVSAHRGYRRGFLPGPTV
jgi:hypothetical protein